MHNLYTHTHAHSIHAHTCTINSRTHMHNQFTHTHAQSIHAHTCTINSRTHMHNQFTHTHAQSIHAHTYTIYTRTYVHKPSRDYLKYTSKRLLQNLLRCCQLRLLLGQDYSASATIRHLWSLQCRAITMVTRDVLVQNSFRLFHVIQGFPDYKSVFLCVCFSTGGAFKDVIYVLWTFVLIS